MNLLRKIVIPFLLPEPSVVRNKDQDFNIDFKNFKQIKQSRSRRNRYFTHKPDQIEKTEISYLRDGFS